MGNLIFTSQTAPSASESSANDNESPEHLVERPILDTAHESLITVDSANKNSNYGLNKQKSRKKKKNKRKVDASAENVSGQGSENTRDNTEVNVPFDHHSASSCPATTVTVETEDQSEIDDEHRSARPSFEHESPQECTSYTKKKRKKRKKKKKATNVDPVGSTCALIEKRLDNWFLKQSQTSTQFTGNVKKRWDSLQGDVNGALTKFASLNVAKSTSSNIITGEKRLNQKISIKNRLSTNMVNISVNRMRSLNRNL